MEDSYKKSLSGHLKFKVCVHWGSLFKCYRLHKIIKTFILHSKQHIHSFVGNSENIQMLIGDEKANILDTVILYYLNQNDMTIALAVNE